MRVPVLLEGRRVMCEVARDATEHARGLQGHRPLEDGQGMLFLFDPPRAATFHMGKVAFPIDILFADPVGRIRKIVQGALPGSRERWSESHVGAVLEVPAGFAASVGASVGSILRPLTDRSAWARGDSPYEDEGGGPPARYLDRALPDDGGNANSEDQPNAHFTHFRGLGPGTPDSADTTDPAGNEVSPAAVRRGQQYPGRADVDPPAPKRYQLDPSKLGPTLLAGAYRTGLHWEDVSTNPYAERLVIGPILIGQWLHAIGLDDAQRAEMHDAIMTRPGLMAIGDAFTAAGEAEQAHVEQVGESNYLIVTRGKDPTPADGDPTDDLGPPDPAAPQKETNDGHDARPARPQLQPGGDPSAPRTP